MMLCDCGGRTEVVNTRQMEQGVRRQRKCVTCRASFLTTEYRDAPKPAPPVVEKPMAKMAAEIHRKKVEARRKNEDRRSYVPNYFIEEEDY
jgi:transcriptional regulator NrdR family protein